VLTHTPPVMPKQDEHLTFTFVTDEVASSIAKAKAAAGPRVGQVLGASVVQQVLRAGLADELHVDVAPCCLAPGCGCLTTRIWRRSPSRRSCAGGRGDHLAPLPGRQELHLHSPRPGAAVRLISVHGEGLRFHDLRHTAATLAAALDGLARDPKWEACSRLLTCAHGWSGRRESNPHRELGKLEFCH
jgi:hypothetical protein